MHDQRIIGVMLAFVATSMGVGGCDCGGASNHGPCADVSDCALGMLCIDGACIPGPDGAVVDSGHPDTGSMCIDVDGDGTSPPTGTCPGGDDCDDTSAATHAGAAEVCGNGVDDDCDGVADEPDCACQRGDRVTCFEGDSAVANVGACRRGVAVCVTEGTPGECRGQVLPTDETCNGVDDNCDGVADEGLRNACGDCGPEVTEACGNGLDDNCDGRVDEDCDCDYRCVCDPSSATCDCRPPTNQPCYEGPFGSDGRGVCTGGRRDCVDDGTGTLRWGSCAGQTVPREECAASTPNGVDDDCDGVVDEGCADGDGDGSAWPSDCDDTDAARHPGAAEVCDGVDDDCDGVADEGVTNACGACGAPAATDTCGNGLDDDCNGLVDDGCSCVGVTTQDCYGGPAGTAGVGTCVSGTQTCSGDEFTFWGECVGQMMPQPEVCDGVDNNCDGVVDERWAAGSNGCGFCDGTEVCDGMDNDCDGLVDEGVANRCGECAPEPVEACNGLDDDCNGVIDDGVTNACGTCEPEPCFTEIWDTPADCAASGRTCDAVEPDPDHPGGVTLGQSTTDFDYIYIAVTGRNQVAQIDTTTGVKNWQVDSHGRWPSRTAVAIDGSVWVTNRAYTGSNPLDVTQSNVVHLSAEDGSLICRAPVVGVARSAAIDGLGNVWAGAYNTGHLWHISGTDVDSSTTPPTCRVIRELDTAVNIYGLTVDPDGFVWTASSPTTIRINTADYSTTSVPNPSFYGIAPDGIGQVWFGGWSGGGSVHAIRRSDFSVLDTGVTQVTAVTVHPDGTVWGSSYGTNEIVGFDGVTGALRCRAPIPSGTNPHGIAVDRTGRLWVPSRFGSGSVNVFDTSCNFVATYTVDSGQELYSYSDMTGHLLRTFTAPEGIWSQTFDSGYLTPYWTQVSWDSIEPAGTGVEVTVRSADEIASLDSGTSCGPFSMSPADLSGCPADLHRHRYLRFDARLFRTSGSLRPTLTGARASWAY